MSNRGELTQGDVLAAIDSAIFAMHQARRMVELYQAQPTKDDGSCKHLRQRDTFAGTVCMDCGGDLRGASQGERGHGESQGTPAAQTI